MRTLAGGVVLAAVLAAAGMGVSGCVSTDTFDKHVEENNAQHAALSGRIDELSSRVGALDGRINQVAQAAQAAQARADAAHTLAQGHFVAQEVGRESVSFETGKSGLSDEAKMTLTALAERLKSENKNVHLEILGHADYRGGKQYNRQLGRERAGNVARFLHDQGVPGSKMQLGSYGEDQANQEAKTAEGLAENRRVDVVITGP
jgi:outer membrane protein OmpA-like peptidoglycan-associated protein